MKEDLLELIKKEMTNFSKGQKAIAKYILHHYDKAAFMTASVLGAEVGVSESTVVRFAVALGYDGYPHLQQALEELIKNRLTTVQRMDMAVNYKLGDDILSGVMSQDIERLRITAEEVSREDFYGSVESLINANHIYIIGGRSSAAVAQFAYFYFNHIFDSVKFVNTSSTSEMFEQIFRINENDVLLGISFPRYSKKTIKAINYAKEKGARVIALTDMKTSPIAENADYALLARNDMNSFADSLVAPLSIVNSLLAAIGIRKKEEIKEVYSKLEQIWDEYEVFEKAEEDITDEKL